MLGTQSRVSVYIIYDSIKYQTAFFLFPPPYKRKKSGLATRDYPLSMLNRIKSTAKKLLKYQVATTSTLLALFTDAVCIGMRLLCRNNFGNNRMEKELRIIPE